MKNSDFSRFLKLVAVREPMFKKALSAANHVMMGGFLDSISYADTSTNHPQTTLSSLPLGQKSAEGAQYLLPGLGNTLRTGDTCSGPDLDALLTHSFLQAAENPQPSSIFDQCDLWQSTRFEDPGGVEQPPTWTPRLQRSQRRPRRYQILPFHYIGRWQLAVFNMTDKIVVSYDPAWTSGSPNFTFVVCWALYACPEMRTDHDSKLLQQWFDATVGNALGINFDCQHRKVSLERERFARELTNDFRISQLQKPRQTQSY